MKRTIVISQKAYLSHKDGQVHIKMEEHEPTVPLEDIGLLMIESHQATISQSALSALMSNNVAVVSCDAAHHPDGIMLPIAGNVLHTAVLRDQLIASVPLRKQLWAQTVKAKILNQAAALKMLGIDAEPIEYWARKIRSGDPDNYEGRAAAHYWKNFFPGDYAFLRDPEGHSPNNLLNYGYAIIRAGMARAVVGSGLHPAVGIHHKNQFNPFCLADDLMEPFRPMLDLVVRSICQEQGKDVMLTPETKKKLLAILGIDCWIEGERKPLLLALTSTTASLVRCYAKEVRVLTYPELHAPE